MLQTASAAKVHDERVIVIRQFAKDLIRLFDDLWKVGGDLFHVVIAFAGKHDTMRLALNGERNFLEIADLERRIVKNIEIFCAERIRFTCWWQTGRNLPTGVR